MQGKSPKTTWFKYNDMDSLKSEILYSEDNKPAVIIEYKYLLINQVVILNEPKQ